VTLEIRFIDRDILNRHKLTFADELDDSIDHQKRIPMRDGVENAFNIE